MKRFILFGGISPVGGMKDFMGSFDDLGKALECVQNNVSELNRWCHVYDTKFDKIVFEKTIDMDKVQTMRKILYLKNEMVPNLKA